MEPSMVRRGNKYFGIKTNGPYDNCKVVVLFNGRLDVIQSTETLVDSIKNVGSYEPVYCPIDGAECLNCASYGDWKYDSSLKKWVCDLHCMNCLSCEA